MEKGFFHPDRGYWQTTGDVPDRILAGYPEGTVEVPIKPSSDHEWNGTAWVEVLPDPAEALAAEQAEAEAKLREMDWVVVRAMEKYLIEQGITKDLPADVMAERGTARVKADKAPKPEKKK